uniref:Uncharacterized protein n=1 Tax=Triticum urartu TaxID=4572 RepID=A0A8R7TED8_TRIUA
MLLLPMAPCRCVASGPVRGGPNRSSSTTASAPRCACRRLPSKAPTPVGLSPLSPSPSLPPSPLTTRVLLPLVGSKPVVVSSAPSHPGRATSLTENNKKFPSIYDL